MINKYASIVDNIVTNIILSSAENLNALGGEEQWIDVSNLPYVRLGNVAQLNTETETYLVYSPKPYNSWTLNENICLWEAPTAYPDNGNKYTWNEDTTSWVETVEE